MGNTVFFCRCFVLVALSGGAVSTAQAQVEATAQAQVNVGPGGKPGAQRPPMGAERPPMGAERPPTETEAERPPSDSDQASGDGGAGGSALWHWLGSAGLGVPVRVNKTRKLGQERLAPAFLDAFGAVVFPTGSVVQHGLGLGVSIGMSEDGGFYEPTPAGSQAALMPAYVAYLPMDADWWALGQVGVPVLLAGGTSAGLEIAGSLGYRVLAGFGAYTQLGLSGFTGESSRVNLLASLEVGLFVDYEVLP